MSITIEDKINIEGITDNLQYAFVASLVDNPWFLERIKHLRGFIGIKKLISYDDADSYIKSLYTSSSYSLNDTEAKKREHTKKAYREIVNNILREFHKNDTYNDIVNFCTVAGMVTDKELKTTAYCVKYPPDDYIEWEEEVPRVAILISAETKKEEVEKLMNTEAKEIFKQLSFNKKIRERGTDEIRTSREWYWEKMNRTYDELYEYVNRADRDADKIKYDRIKRAVERYMKHIS